MDICAQEANTLHVLIIPEAVREGREGAAEQFEIEKHNLMARNYKLENEVRNLKSLLSSDGESSTRPRMLSGLSDAVVGAIRRNTATSQSSAHDEETVLSGTKSLEKSMEKVMAVPAAAHIHVHVTIVQEDQLSLKNTEIK